MSFRRNNEKGQSKLKVISQNIMVAIKTLNELFKECPPMYLHDGI